MYVFNLLFDFSAHWNLTKHSKAYEMLASRIPSTLGTTPVQTETREMNPTVKFWTRQEWTAATADRVADLDEGVNVGTRGRTWAAQGINVNMKYIEDRNGQPINGHLASDIRRHARAIFVGLALKGYLFTSWTEADHDSLKTYYREMAERFEELRLCANDWKAEMIALDIYRTWRDQWEKRQQKKKMTDKNISNDQVEGNKDCNKSDSSDDKVSVKHGIDRATHENGRATKKMKSGYDAIDHTGTTQMQQVVIIRIFKSHLLFTNASLLISSLSQTSISCQELRAVQIHRR